jgi:uncharacterized repeat protein (TIGR01451 family)
MKGLILSSLTAIMMVTGSSLITNSPFFNTKAVAVAPQSQNIQLKLTAAKKIVVNNQVKLQQITAGNKVKPQDLIIYSLNTTNNSAKSVNKLSVIQPIPQGTIYIANSASSVNGSQVFFSIDGGKTFSSTPMIKDKPAPTSVYTHIQWKFNRKIAAKEQINTSYEVRVR